MTKIRIYDLAKELEISPKELAEKIKAMGIEIKSHSSTLTEEEVERVMDIISEEKKRPEPKESPKVSEEEEKSSPQAIIIKRREEKEAKPKRIKLKIRRKKPKAEEAAPPEPVPEKGPPEAKPLEAPEEVAPPEKPKEEPEGKPEETIELKARIISRIETEKFVPEKKPKKRIVKDFKPRKPAPPPPPEEVKEEKEKEKKKKKVKVERPEAEEKPKKKSKKKGAPPKREREEILEELELMEELEKEPEGLEMLAEEEEKEEAKKVSQEKKVERPPTLPPKKKKIKVHETIQVGELAKLMGVRAADLIKKFMELGTMVTINQSIDAETAAIVASEFGYEVEAATVEEEALLEYVPPSPEELKPRPPIVTVMGHVDHGKTTLLDAIRHTDVAAKEAGGITQHIGAYKVKLPDGREITFIDTPGHEAFTSMRARGAQVTDIVILVVAADDGVMDQTREAIDHAKAAGVPIVVAINKIDKPEANPERVKSELAELGLVPEDWGGETLMVEISAKKRQGIEDLLELVLLQAEMLDLKAAPDRPARGRIIESRLDKGKGPVATVIIQEGTLREGDPFVAGMTYGRVRAMLDEYGRRLKEAPPATPVEILGFEEVPQAGDDFIVMPDETKARRVAEYRQRKAREAEAAKEARLSLEKVFEKLQEGEIKELKIVLKADVQGTLEALSDALRKLSTEEVRVTIIRSGIGAISESDVMLAAASEAIVIGFNVRPTSKAKEIAKQEKVDIRYYDVIYHALEEIKKALSGLLEPEYEERLLGVAEVRATFRVPKVGTVAGCYVKEGKIVRGGNVRLLREGVVVYTGKIASLKRFKEDVREVAAGYECGVGLENFNDIKEGDMLEVYEMVEIKREI
ncbi:translation initiation factor IF-2 [Thermosulfurimonas dismutans]|uniref:Translation initiation factor IF-2 n=1 Tax=Thermosulfurimonas dismutans TaxID=999894 RepID=A0A179D4E1_9BACT|nr:translation initiation factor IF-2 [Thermosulfurimonas dismutans]OAQ20488.1 Translation initiation factor 2 [Thermosulfurimonas dismutans]